MTITNIRLLVLALLTILMFFADASAASVNQSGSPAVQEYDPVAYFTEKKEVKGSDQFHTQYEGVTYKFQSAANRDAFAANPSKYAPQDGGYCSYGVASGHKADIDPKAFTDVNERPYCSLDKPCPFPLEEECSR